MTNIDKILIKYLLETKDEDLLIKIPKTIFKRKIQKQVFNQLLQYYEEHNEIPSLNKLQETIKLNLPDNEADICNSFLENIEAINSDYSKEELEKFIKKANSIRIIDDNIEELVLLAKEKEIDKFYDKLNSLSEKLLTNRKTPVDVRDRQFENEKIVMVEPFLPSMREAGLMFTGVSIIGAGSGMGKSVLLLNQLMYNYEQGEDVCLLNFELDYNETLARMYSFATKTPFYKVYVNPEDGIKEKVNKWREEYFNRSNHFYIEDEPLNINEVENIIKVYAKKGVKIFGIDYLNIIEMPSSREEWKSLASFVKKLHRLSKKLGIVIISPTQVNVEEINEKQNKVVVTARGSKELIFSGSVFIYIHQNREEFQKKVARIFTIKARNASKETYVVKTNFNTMCFEDTGLIIPS